MGGITKCAHHYAEDNNNYMSKLDPETKVLHKFTLIFLIIWSRFIGISSFWKA